MGDVVLACRELRKHFGERVAVDGVGFEVAAGETYGLLGPNGAGKTTTISMVCGLLAPDGGEVLVGGRPLTPAATEAKADIGLVPQDIALYLDLTARENLRFFGRLQGLGGRDLDGRVDEVLAVVGLTDRADDRVDDYSGGMKRRANIAAGLLHRPRLLVLDEPTVGVDPQSRNAILQSIEELGGAGLAVVYTTHYMEEAERLCDRVGILDEGRLVAEGTRRELVERVGTGAGMTITATGDLDAFAAACLAVPGVTAATVVGDRVELRAHDGSRALAPVVEAAERTGVQVSGVDVSEPDLEDVFLHLTGKALRD